ncbi:MAG: MerC domain-containing protein [Bacteroidota bacterium]|nr:MerC domain-containing protein [Bacteroidota bacterium]
MFRFKINWDALGIAASVACAIHCAILPLLLTSLPLFGIEIIHNQMFEYGMVVLAFIIGSHSLYKGWKKQHHHPQPLLVFTVGMLFLVAKQIWHNWELLLLIPAVTGIVMGHYLNYRYTVSGHCSTGDCKHQ